MTQTFARRTRAAVVSLGVAVAVGLGMISAPSLAAAEAPVIVSAATTSVSAQLKTFDQEMIKLVNAKRTAAGLVALKEAKGLTSLSVWWSSQMAAGKTGYALQHNSKATSMLPSYGASNWGFWAENVARWNPASISAKSIFDAYWGSPGHKANILQAKARYIGMGTVSGGSGWTFNTMTFTDKVESGQIVVASVPVVKPAAAGRVEKVSVSNGYFRATGWAFSRVKSSVANKVRIVVTGPKAAKPFYPLTTVSRSDVNRIYKITGTHGFNVKAPLFVGKNRVCVASISHSGGTNTELGCWTVTR